MRAPAFWSQPQPNLTARLLAPFGALYSLVTASRMARSGVKLDIPVLCVGNFTAGGAGKTPTCVALAQALLKYGHKPAFVSRGYGGALSGPQPLRVNPSKHTSAEVGDEPLLLARVAPCYISSDRVAAARAARDEGASLIILDDGMQNPQLAKNFVLAVVDSAVGLGNGLSLPAGPLRAALSAQIRYIDAILLIGDEPPAATLLDAANAHNVPLFKAKIVPDANIAAGLNGQRVFAFAGIGRPEKFFATLRATGAEIAATQSFPDHHQFSKNDMTSLATVAKARGVIPVTTEKDAMRLPPALRDHVVALPISLEIAAISQLLAQIQTKIPSP